MEDHRRSIWTRGPRAVSTFPSPRHLRLPFANLGPFQPTRILFLITLIIFSSSLQRHRRSGAPLRSPKVLGMRGDQPPTHEVGGPDPIQMNPIRTVTPTYGNE